MLDSGVERVSLQPEDEDDEDWIIAHTELEFTKKLGVGSSGKVEIICLWEY